MAISTGNFGALLWPCINALFGDSYKDWSPEYQKFMEKSTSTMAFEKDQGVTGVGLLGVKSQGANISYTDPRQGFAKEYPHVTYSLGVQVTWEMAEDEQYGYINRLTKHLKRSAQITRETVAANVLNNAFSTETTADGLSLINANHLNVGGGTQSNTLSLAADLSQTSVEALCVIIGATTDDNGLPIMLRPTRVIVPNALQFDIERILKTKEAVGSNDNDINPIASMGFDALVSHYLVDPDAWFIKTDAAEGLKFIERSPIKLARENEFDNLNLKMAVIDRYAVGATDWKGLFGTAGA